MLGVNILRNLILALLVVLIASGVNAKEYGHYDLKSLITVSETSAGKKYGFNISYLDQF